MPSGNLNLIFEGFNITIRTPEFDSFSQLKSECLCGFQDLKFRLNAHFCSTIYTEK